MFVVIACLENIPEIVSVREELPTKEDVVASLSSFLQREVDFFDLCYLPFNDSSETTHEMYHLPSEKSSEDVVISVEEFPKKSV